MKPSTLYPKDMYNFSYQSEYNNYNNQTEDFYPASYPEQFGPPPAYDEGTPRNMMCVNPQELFGLQLSSPPMESYDYHAPPTYSSGTRHSVVDRDQMDYISTGPASTQRRRTAPVNMYSPRDQSGPYRLEVPSSSSSRRSSRPSPTMTSVSTSPLTPPLSPATTDLYPQPPNMISHSSHHHQQHRNTDPVRRSSHSHSQSLSLPSNIATTTTSSPRYYCTHADCTTTNPSDPSSTTKRPRSFSRRADLQRHHDTTHDPKAPVFSCPRHNCARKGDNGFSRQDHLIEHRRGYHGEDIPKRGARGRRDSAASSGSKDGKKRTKVSSQRRDSADHMTL